MDKTREEIRRDTRRLLWRWGKVTMTCARLQKQLQDYLNLIESASDVHGSPLTGMPGSGKIGDPTSKAAERMMYLKERYQEMADIITHDIDEEIRFATALDEAMGCLEVQERRIVEMKYRLGMSARRIHFATHYHERTVERIDGKAVDKLSDYIKMSENVGIDSV